MRQRMLLLLALIAVASSGCASYKSLVDRPDGGPLLMSGTRMNLASMSATEEQLKARFGSSAPAYPLLDLPLSLVADVIALWATVPSALSARVIE